MDNSRINNKLWDILTANPDTEDAIHMIRKEFEMHEKPVIDGIANLRARVVEIEAPSGSTAAAFEVDRSGNIIRLMNLSLADIDGDYLFETERELIRLQMHEDWEH